MERMNQTPTVEESEFLPQIEEHSIRYNYCSYVMNSCVLLFGAFSALIFPWNY